MTFDILPFSPELAPDFDRINRDWITKYFVVEPFDDEVLRNPERLIINTGGEIYFARLNGMVVGCCALLPLEPGVYEFTKLGVDAPAQGKGIARALMRHALGRARAKGGHLIRLFTNSALKPANALYVAEGYQEIPLSEDMRARYKRCDIIYEHPL